LFSCDDFASVKDAEQVEQDDHWNGDAEKPEQNAAHGNILSKYRMQPGCSLILQPRSGISMAQTGQI
jgi:hypothetical protein